MLESNSPQSAAPGAKSRTLTNAFENWRGHMTDDLQQRRDNLQAAANAALETWYGHLPAHSEMRRLASVVLGQLVEYHASGKSKKAFQDELHEADQFLKLLRAELNPLNASSIYPEGGTARYKRTFYEDRLSEFEKNENPEGWLSFFDRKFSDPHQCLLALLEKGSDSKLYWPMNLGYGLTVYLRTPWLQCEDIDILLVRAMIYECVLERNESMTLASLNPYSKEFRKQNRIAIARTLLGLLLAGLVGASTANAFGWWAGLIGILGFAALVGIVDHFAWARSRADKQRIAALQDQMCSAFELTFRRPFSVRLLRERLVAMDDGKGGIVPAEVFSIIDCAIGRGVILWGNNA